mgnify:CR=1 FL=1
MELTIKILGTGCSKCKILTKLTEEVVKENNINASVEKVEDIMKIMEYNVMTTPALVVNEKIVSKGSVPSKTEILKLIQSEKEIKNNNNQCCCSSEGCC